MLFFDPVFLLPFEAGLGRAIEVFAVAGLRCEPAPAFTLVFLEEVFFSDFLGCSPWTNQVVMNKTKMNPISLKCLVYQTILLSGRKRSGGKEARPRRCTLSGLTGNGYRPHDAKRNRSARFEVSLQFADVVR